MLCLDKNTAPLRLTHWNFFLQYLLIEAGEAKVFFPLLMKPLSSTLGARNLKAGSQSRNGRVIFGWVTELWAIDLESKLLNLSIMRDLSSLYVNYFFKRETFNVLCPPVVIFLSLTWILQMCVQLEVIEQNNVFIDFKNIFEYFIKMT